MSTEDSEDLSFTAIKQWAREHWLRKPQIISLLRNYIAYGLELSHRPPNTPPSGSLFLFDKKVVKCWRRDSYEWKLKNNHKNVQEHHERLKVNGVETINCCYVRHARLHNFHRRAYWLLDHVHIVLVHYLSEQNSRPPPIANPSYSLPNMQYPINNFNSGVTTSVAPVDPRLQKLSFPTLPISDRVAQSYMQTIHHEVTASVQDPVIPAVAQNNSVYVQVYAYDTVSSQSSLTYVPVQNPISLIPNPNTYQVGNINTGYSLVPSALKHTSNTQLPLTPVSQFLNTHTDDDSSSILSNSTIHDVNSSVHTNISQTTSTMASRVVSNLNSNTNNINQKKIFPTSPKFSSIQLTERTHPFLATASLMSPEEHTFNPNSPFPISPGTMSFTTSEKDAFFSRPVSSRTASLPNEPSHLNSFVTEDESSCDAHSNKQKENAITSTDDIVRILNSMKTPDSSSRNVQKKRKYNDGQSNTGDSDKCAESLKNTITSLRHQIDADYFD